MLERAQIEGLIPHAGSMVLLDRVDDFDDRTIRCTTDSHRRPENPLRVDGHLPAVCGAEYGAQAAAVHGPALDGISRPGRLVLLRDLRWSLSDLAAVDGSLQVVAERLHADAAGIAYSFRLIAGDRDIVSGECGVLFP